MRLAISYDDTRHTTKNAMPDRAARGAQPQDARGRPNGNNKDKQDDAKTGRGSPSWETRALHVRPHARKASPWESSSSSSSSTPSSATTARRRPAAKRTSNAPAVRTTARSNGSADAWLQQRLAERAENARLNAQREREYQARHQQETNNHNALVQHNRMTPGTSTPSRTYWN